MKQTMTQKILAAHTKQNEATAGQLIVARLDMALANDVTAPVAIKEFKKAGFSKVFSKSKICLVLDHFTPNKDIKSAEQCKYVREFAADYGIENFFDAGDMGIEHALLPEKGLVISGDLVIGADSHTCTYGALGAFATGVGSTDLAAGMASGEAWFKVPSAIKFVLKNKPAKYITGKDIILHIIGLIGVDGALYKSMEFFGDLSYLSIDDRFTICNMAIEAGAKNGIFPVDKITLDFLKNKTARKPAIFAADEDAEYERTVEVDMSRLKPTVAFPHLPSNTRTVDEAGSVKIDQCVIGSCTNGHLSDLKIAADIFKGRRVKKGVRTIIFPATNKIYLEALKAGYIRTFIEAGAIVSTPTCGPCLGGHMGILARGERAVATTNRNFVGRMGHPESEVYLASPYVAAASAVLGRLASPDEL
jgi:3-isopropylmalate/(R)-2-methylmalate dehydratase large subunit